MKAAFEFLSKCISKCTPTCYKGSKLFLEASFALIRSLVHKLGKDRAQESYIEKIHAHICLAILTMQSYISNVTRRLFAA